MYLFFLNLKYKQLLSQLNNNINFIELISKTRTCMYIVIYSSSKAQTNFSRVALGLDETLRGEILVIVWFADKSMFL